MSQRSVVARIWREARAAGRVSGEQAWRLYTSHGLPLDVIEEGAQSLGCTVDLEGFQRYLAEERQKSRAKGAFGGKGLA